MHELSICQGLRHQLDALAEQHAATAITQVTVRIGALSGVESQLLAQAFPIAMAGGPAADAILVCESLPIRVRCSSCGAETGASANKLICGACGDWQTTLLSGDELLLASVEMSKDEPADTQLMNA